MGKRQTAAARRGSTPTSEGSVRNDERPLPRDVAALFEGLVKRSTRAAQADHRLQTKVAEAVARLRREQARLSGALVKQLGVSELARDLAAARERHVRMAIETMDASHSSAAGGRRAAADRTTKTKTKTKTRRAKTR